MATSRKSSIIELLKPVNGPIKCNDNKYMYNHCKKKITNAKSAQELLPIINRLIPMDILKKNLIEIIDDLYNITLQSNATLKTKTNQLRKLYLNSSSIAEIFPDQILLNIIKYLPSKQFGLLPLLSSNFHQIMTKYPLLYSNYKVIIDEIPMHINTQCVKLLINHNKKCIYIKQAQLDIDQAGLQHSASINSLMFNQSFDSKWGGLIPRFSMGHSFDGNSQNVKILNPFSASFPWSIVPKWILFGDKWASNISMNASQRFSPMTTPNTGLHLASFDVSATSNGSVSPQRFKSKNVGMIGHRMASPSFDSNGSIKNHKFVRDIWKCCAQNVLSLELENTQNSFLGQLPKEFDRLNHLKFSGTFNESPVAHITFSRFSSLAYLEVHKMQIEGSSIAMIDFIESEKKRYENLDDFDLPQDEMNEFISIRARINYRYQIINDILQCFEQLLVFKYYDDGSLINSLEMELSEYANQRIAQQQNPQNNADNNDDNNDDNEIGSMQNMHISSSGTVKHIGYISKLRQNNGCILFPESLEFVSLINCDCLLDFSKCRGLIAMNLYGVNQKQIIKWPIHSIVACLVCSTQTEMTEDWNDIFEANKYRIDTHLKKNNFSNQFKPTMPTLYSLQNISPVASKSFEYDRIPVRFMKRITNRTLSPIVQPQSVMPKHSELDSSASFNINNIMTRSMSNNNAQRKTSSNLAPLVGLNRNKSAGSNSSMDSMATPKDLVINVNVKEKVPKIYVENKLNKTKSLNLWNNNVMEALDINMNGLGLASCESFGSQSLDVFEEENSPRFDSDFEMETMQNKKSVVFDIFEEYKKMEYVVKEKDKDLMCMEIEDDGEIFYRLMRTLYAGKKDLLKNKVERYENWWNMKVASWIKHIGKQIVPKSHRNII